MKKLIWFLIIALFSAQVSAFWPDGYAGCEDAGYFLCGNGTVSINGTALSSNLSCENEAWTFGGGTGTCLYRSNSDFIENDTVLNGDFSLEFDVTITFARIYYTPTIASNSDTCGMIMFNETGANAGDKLIVFRTQAGGDAAMFEWNGDDTFGFCNDNVTIASSIGTHNLTWCRNGSNSDFRVHFNGVERCSLAEDNNQVAQIGFGGDDAPGSRMVYALGVVWNGTENDFPTAALETIPPTLAVWNVTSNNTVGNVENTTIWNRNTNITINITSDLLAFTFTASESSNCTARLDTPGNYSQMFDADPNFKLATTDTTSHSYTISETITAGNHCAYVSCTDALGNEPPSGETSSSCLNFTLHVGPEFSPALVDQTVPSGSRTVYIPQCVGNGTISYSSNLSDTFPGGSAFTPANGTMMIEPYFSLVGVKHNTTVGCSSDFGEANGTILIEVTAAEVAAADVNASAWQNLVVTDFNNTAVWWSLTVIVQNMNALTDLANVIISPDGKFGTGTVSLYVARNSTNSTTFTNLSVRDIGKDQWFNITGASLTGNLTYTTESISQLLSIDPPHAGLVKRGVADCSFNPKITEDTNIDKTLTFENSGHFDIDAELSVNSFELDNPDCTVSIGNEGKLVIG